MTKIITGSNYGDPRKQAARDDTPHGLTPNTIEQLRDRFESFVPGMTNTHGEASRQFFDGILPKGAELAPTVRKQANFPGGAVNIGGNTFGGGGGSTYITQQRPYQPEFEDPSRQQYPVHRILANRYWRLFYKLDPVIGNCLDLYATMPWSDFQLSGEGITGEIKEQLETMCSETNILQVLEYMTREFMVIGEAAPHCFLDDAKGIWTYVALHNPDQLEVIDAPFIKMHPIIEFIPDDRLRAVLTSNNHLLRGIRDQMPQELISRLIARQNVPLSPVNVTFIPRKMHPYDTRGTSIISRMWRILMYEDGVYNASIATARRHAGPLKVAKLGNPQTGWIPSSDHERRLLQLLAQAELDPNAWLVYHYGINFELVGTTDRIMNINQHHDVIERIKLIAMGISKSFMHGEVSYASASTGLSVFLQRMRAMRSFFVNTWLIPKFFKPIAQINGWVRRDKKELNFRYRIKRSQRQIDEENRWVIPKIVWEKQLDSSVNTELVNAMNTLEQLGITFSKTTKYSAAGRKYEEELHQIKDEQEFEQELGVAAPPEPPPPNPSGGAPPLKKMAPPVPGGGANPNLPGVPAKTGPSVPNAPSGNVESDKTGTGSGSGPSGKRDPAVRDTESPLWDAKGRSGNWSAHEVTDLRNLLIEGNTDSPLWGALDSVQLRSALNAGDVWETIELIENHLLAEGYPPEDVKHLKRILDKEGILRDIADGENKHLKSVERGLGDEISNLSDSAAMDHLAAQIDDRKPDIVRLGSEDALLVGQGNQVWSGDISSMINE